MGPDFSPNFLNQILGWFSKINYRNGQRGPRGSPQRTTESVVFIGAVGTVLASVAQGLGACAVPVPALELSQTAEAVWAQIWFVGAV